VRRRIRINLKFPTRYGRKFHEDSKREIEALIEYGKKGLIQYYAKDAYNYIIARSHRCLVVKG